MAVIIVFFSLKLFFSRDYKMSGTRPDLPDGSTLDSKN
jgi:hypothetical protein